MAKLTNLLNERNDLREEVASLNRKIEELDKMVGGLTRENARLFNKSQDLKKQLEKLKKKNG